MTNLVWPIDLPQRLTYSSYTRRAGDVRQWTPYEGSEFSRVRRKYSRGADVVPLSFPAQLSQVARFERFYDEEANKGISLFTMPDQERDGAQWLYDDGSPVMVDDETPALISARWLCRFGQEPYDIARVGGIYQVSFQVLVLG